MSADRNAAKEMVEKSKQMAVPVIIIDEKDMVLEDTPSIKANAGVNAKFDNGVSAGITGSYAGACKRLDMASEEYSEIDPYLLWSGRLGYSFGKDALTLYLSVFNMFNNKHYESVPGIDKDHPRVSLVERKITGGAVVRF